MVLTSKCCCHEIISKSDIEHYEANLGRHSNIWITVCRMDGDIVYNK